MPKETFLQLSADKRNQFVDAFLREFTLNNYDDASISRTMKQLKMAKGSFYQYFENKLVLFQYLQESCGMTKALYIQSIQRDDFDDFWDYWRALYRAGMQFDREHPKKSNFLYSLHKNMNAPSLQPMYQNWYNQVISAMESMIQPEIEKGHFRDDVPIRQLAFFFFGVSNQLVDMIRLNDGGAMEKNVKNGQPIFANGNDQVLMDTLENNIRMLSAAMNKQH